MAYRKTKQVREQLAGKRLRIYTAARQPGDRGWIP